MGCMSTEQTATPAITVDQLNEFLRVGYNGPLGLTATEVSADRLCVEWEITPEQHQPYGITHGGVYCTVIETLTSIAAGFWYGDKGNVVGVNNNTDFLRAAREGILRAEVVPLHRGRSQQLWQAVITDEQGRMVARGQVRLQNLPK